MMIDRGYTRPQTQQTRTNRKAKHLAYSMGHSATKGIINMGYNTVRLGRPVHITHY